MIDSSMQQQDIPDWKNQPKIASEIQVICQLDGIEPLAPQKDFPPFYFKAKRGGAGLFIKWGHNFDSCQHECTYGKALHEVSPLHFQNYIGAFELFGMGGLVSEYIAGQDLEILVRQEALSTEQRTSIIHQLAEIAEHLFGAGIVHRDLRPSNLFLTDKGTVMVIDPQYAVKACEYQECAFLRKYPQQAFHLGAQYRYKPLLWDDMHSLAKLMRELGAREIAPQALDTVQARIGRLQIHYPNRRRLLFRKQLLKVISYIVPVSSWRKRLRNH